MDSPGVVVFNDGSFSWVKFLDGDPNRYTTSGTQLTGAQLAYAQAFEAGGSPTPVGESPPINWDTTSS
jgi:hypothetical protein